MRWRSVRSSPCRCPPRRSHRTRGGAYFEFLLARRLEGLGDFAAAQAALERAAKLDARSSEVRAELGAFHLRRSQPEEAEAAAKAALAIDSNNIEGHRVLGLVYAGYADGGSQQRASRRRRPRSS